MGTPTYADKVNEVIATVTKDESGKLVMPEGTDEALAFAATTELRRRDTQSAYTKGQQTIKALEAENTGLTNSWEEDAVANLSSAEQAKLEELKTQDPDAWRAEINVIEETKRTSFKDKRKAISAEAQNLTELEQRTLQLTNHNSANPDFQLTDDVIANDLPPRIVRKLENGESTFEEFLAEAGKYLGKSKKIDGGDEAPNEPNFAGARGTAAPTDEAAKAQSTSDYKNEIF